MAAMINALRYIIRVVARADTSGLASQCAPSRANPSGSRDATRKRANDPWPIAPDNSQVNDGRTTSTLIAIRKATATKSWCQLAR